jgi:hypothetical protein
MTKHKLAHLIHAWADGAKIQFRHGNGPWQDCGDNHPSWMSSIDYRIAPAKPVICPDGWVCVPRELTREMSNAVKVVHSKPEYMWAEFLANVPPLPKEEE